ncbi:MAG: hypothetical protein V1897_20050 [Pseudomonadota bacterium]
MEFQGIWILLAMFSAIFTAILARQKNRSPTKWFWVGLILGPFGLLLLVGFFPKIEYEFVGLYNTKWLSK